MKPRSATDEVMQMLAEAEADDVLAAQAWLACRGQDPLDVGPLALVGALREVRNQKALTQCAKSLMWISGALGRKE